MRFLLSALLLSGLSISCAKRSELVFSDPVSEARALERKHAQLEKDRRDREAKKLVDKKMEMKEIISNANSDFKVIAPIIQRKCFACHDANTKLPFYGRILRSRNPSVAIR